MITRALSVVVLVLLAVIGLQRVQILKQRHTIDRLEQEAEHALQMSAMALVVDSAMQGLIDEHRRRAETLQHDLDSLTQQLTKKHAPLPPRPVTAPELRDAILRATSTP